MTIHKVVYQFSLSEEHLGPLLLFRPEFLMMSLVLTRVWLDRIKCLLSILAHSDSQIYLSLCIGSLPAKDTSKVNICEAGHSQNEHTVSISSHWYWE